MPGLMTGAGSTISISAGVPATQDAAGYAALTYTEVANVEKIGTIGATFKKTEFQGLKGALQKLKGSADYGAVQPSVAVDTTDAGQTLLKTAGNNKTNALYAMKIVLQDGTKFYFQVRVFGWPITVDNADGVVMAAPTCEICVEPVEVAAP